MALFHYIETITNDAGDALSGYYVKLKNSGGAYATLYSDSSNTPISAVSGVTDTAVTDARGRVSIYVSEGSYTVEIFDKNDITSLIDSVANVPMIAADAATPVGSETGTSYTLDIEDENTVLVMTNASAITLTIPPEASVNFAIGTFVEIHQGGAGQITPTAGSGVTLTARGSFTKTAAQYAVAGLRKIASDSWILTGDLA